MGLCNINVTLNNEKGDWSVSNGLVFSMDDVKRLRELGICGVLSGSLPTLAQQNVFLSVPLRLMAEETLWLVKNGWARLSVTDSSTVQRLLRSADIRDAVHGETMARINESFELQKQVRFEKHLKKMEKYGRHVEPNAEVAPNFLFQEVFNDSVALKHSESSTKKAMDVLLSQRGAELLVFSHLKNLGFVISPGARFGGKYIIYPGDPLRFHSHLIVSAPIDYYEDSIDFHNMIDGARLATSVKKTWVIHGRKGDGDKEDDLSFFSVEWAGFG